jgi:hypothetical protein
VPFLVKLKETDKSKKRFHKIETFSGLQKKDFVENYFAFCHSPSVIRHDKKFLRDKQIL